MKLPKVKMPIDGGDALYIGGVAFCAVTVYVLWPAWVYAFVGVSLLIVWLSKELTNGISRPRR